MGVFLKYLGLKHPAPENQEAWFEIAATCFIAVRASNPKWTFGLMRWIKRYTPDLYRNRSAAWIDARVNDLRREGRFFGPQEIGAKLGVTREAFFAHDLFDMWPAGMTEAERKQASRDRKAAWQRAHNLANGLVKRPHAQSQARNKPWEREGISESTWRRRERKRKQGER
jgi:hypothetical protein